MRNAPASESGSRLYDPGHAMLATGLHGPRVTWAGGSSSGTARRGMRTRGAAGRPRGRPAGRLGRRRRRPGPGRTPSYSHVGVAAGRLIADGEADRALLVCGTGIGVAMAAGTVPGVRASVAHDAYSVERLVKSNNAQVLTLAQRVIGLKWPHSVVSGWLDHRFDESSASAPGGGTDRLPAGQRPARSTVGAPATTAATFHDWWSRGPGRRCGRRTVPGAAVRGPAPSVLSRSTPGARWDLGRTSRGVSPGRRRLRGRERGRAIARGRTSSRRRARVSRGRRGRRHRCLRSRPRGRRSSSRGVTDQGDVTFVGESAEESRRGSEPAEALAGSTTECPERSVSAVCRTS